MDKKDSMNMRFDRYERQYEHEVWWIRETVWTWGWWIRETIWTRGL